MQTFLPYRDMVRSVWCLDDRRLGKQRVEAYQILRVLDGRTIGWRHHPAVLMWHGRKDALRLFMDLCINEWVRRGHRNTMRLSGASVNAPLPVWFGDDRVHSSHRSNLLRKDPAYYGRYGWTERPDMPYYWPVTYSPRL